MSRQLPKEVVRAKGFLTHNSRVYLYSYVMGQYTIEEKSAAVKEFLNNTLVFIFQPQALKALEQLLGSYNFVKKEI